MKLFTYKVLLLPLFSSLVVASSYPQKEYLTGDWDGGRTVLQESRLHIGLSYTAEPAALVSGGYETGSTYLHNINLEFKADLERLAGVGKTTFLAKFSSRNGQNLSEKNVVPASNADGRYSYGEYFNKSQEVYGGQKTKMVNFQLTTQIKDTISIDGGRLVINDFFLRSDIYCDFMSNAACGAPKGIFTPYALDAYPDATMGLHSAVAMGKDITLYIGIFDGGWAKQEPTGFDWSLGLNGIVYTGELQYLIEEGATYGEKKIIKLGVNHHSGEFDNFTTSEMTDGSTSYYILADIGIYSEGSTTNQGLSLFGSYVFNTDDEIAGVTNFYNLGSQAQCQFLIL